MHTIRLSIHKKRNTNLLLMRETEKLISTKACNRMEKEQTKKSSFLFPFFVWLQIEWRWCNKVIKLILSKIVCYATANAHKMCGMKKKKCLNIFKSESIYRSVSSFLASMSSWSSAQTNMHIVDDIEKLLNHSNLSIWLNANFLQ